MAKNVVGLFDNPSDAQAAVHDLESAGFGGNNVSLIRNASRGLLSSFEQLRMPQEDANIYQEGIRNGGAVVIVQQLADDDANRAAAILDRYNLVDIDARRRSYGRTTETATTTATETATTTATAGATHLQQTRATVGQASSGTGRRNLYEGGDMVIPIVEEEVQVGKREVEGGGVRVTTSVQERPVEEQVTLRDETVQVERRPVDRPVTDADVAQVREGTVEIREHDEQAVVSKQARIVEEVVIKKDVRQRPETIQDTVRRTDVQVEEIPASARAIGAGETTSTATPRRGTAGNTGNEGARERGASTAENAAERLTQTDLNRDGDVGQRDPRNNA